LWQSVIPHFSSFLKELELKPQERLDAETKANRIAKRLWAKYYAGDFNPNCYVIVGSYGKRTAIRPPSDLDMLFLLPSREYLRVEELLGNKQSQLLAQVKEAMAVTLPRTDLRADGQVVIAPLQTYKVEVTPAFQFQDETYITAHTADGGSWRVSNPAVEYQTIRNVDSVSFGKATDLTKMLKAWKRECSVDVKSISLEVFVCEFVNQWPHREQSLYWYDWLVRDFFEFMLRYRQNAWNKVPGTAEVVYLGDAWVSKCETAYSRALKACESEQLDHPYSATEEWQKIFGQQFTGSTPSPFSLSFLARAMAASR
jgi:hypothetical protein